MHAVVYFINEGLCFVLVFFSFLKKRKKNCDAGLAVKYGPNCLSLLKCKTSAVGDCFSQLET